MSTIVYQDSQSFSESNIIKTTTLKLKLPTPSSIIETTLPHQENITSTNEKCWSSLRNLSTNYSKEKENSYVHPLSSRLSEKSLALCTENLGSENGTDHIIGSSIFSYSLHESQSSIRVKSNYDKVMTCNDNESCHKFPPPLTTLIGSNAIQVRSHREGDRLVIKAIEAPKMRTYFHAERSNGRLRLCFLSNECTSSKFDLSEKTNEEEINGELEIEKEVFESEINEEEENGMYIKGNCQRMRRCNQGRQDNKKFCDWRNPFWVATS